jgi:hypothetical protein
MDEVGFNQKSILNIKKPLQSFNNLAQYSRCDSAQSLLEHGCNPDQIVNPQSSLRTVQNQPFTDGTDEDEPTIQLRPQHVEVFIRPSQFVLPVIL